MDEALLRRIKEDLVSSVDPTPKRSPQSFFKEEIKTHGVKSAVVERISAGFFKEIRDRGKNEILSLCEALLQTDYVEEAIVACNWAYALRDQYEPRDFEVFQEWLYKYINNWAKCDTLCNHTIGTFVEEFPEYVKRLKEWTGSENRWVRRASAVTLILPARKGRFLKEILEIADSLLEDRDDLVQKGYGWMLKEASRLHQREVFDYVMRKKTDMPRTALRYAIEKMPGGLRQKAMEK